MNFKGRDWTELATSWCILLDHRKDEEILQDIDQKLKESVNLTGIQNNDVIRDAKEFLSFFVKNFNKNTEAAAHNDRLLHYTNGPFSVKMLQVKTLFQVSVERK
ncbi:hypothetical protein [Paenibacillus sp. PL91]|uniref:hypothetical protein n=1 Tax=Paenibacillus sp. PL91 TaxID=2729538 RepID=UPI00145D9950|nr:hypothetical protein [Paenibacillus sp. PL91]MBC9202943.1 hypothetical protein [Paenibacillus sp. PL91]